MTAANRLRRNVQHCQPLFQTIHDKLILNFLMDVELYKSFLKFG